MGLPDRGQEGTVGREGPGGGLLVSSMPRCETCDRLFSSQGFFGLS